MTPREAFVCRLAEVPDGRARGFALPGIGELFVVRRGGNVYAYLNSCPHTGVSLDWLPDQFLDEQGSLIQCATHGALFEIDSGLCVAGPCAGECLTAVPVAVNEGSVIVQCGSNRTVDE